MGKSAEKEQREGRVNMHCHDLRVRMAGTEIKIIMYLMDSLAMTFSQICVSSPHRPDLLMNQSFHGNRPVGKDLPLRPWACTHSPVSRLMRDGESQSEARVLIDSTAAVLAAHSTYRGKSYRE